MALKFKSYFFRKLEELFTNLSYSFQKRFQPVFIAFTVTIQEGQHFCLCCICPSDTGAHQAWEVKIESYKYLLRKTINSSEKLFQVSH